jgi:hypothetical protein
MPQGCHLEFAGQEVAWSEAAQQLVALSGAMIGIFLMLDFKANGLSLMVMLSV